MFYNAILYWFNKLNIMASDLHSKPLSYLSPSIMWTVTGS